MRERTYVVLNSKGMVIGNALATSELDAVANWNSANRGAQEFATEAYAKERQARFTVGDRVRFRDEVEDAGCVFDVIEDNGDRVIIRLVCDMPIKPTKVMLRSELCKV